ncbi:type II toxin-antitoxin system Phd/YefM family antitoxin [Mycobacterium sp. LTG2003]
MVCTIGIGQLRGDTRNYVERVAAGETFEVLRRGRPIARLQAAHGCHDILIAVPLNELRTRAARVFDRVAAGETIAVEYHGRTVAALRPCTGAIRVKPSRIHAAARQTPVA